MTDHEKIHRDTMTRYDTAKETFYTELYPKGGIKYIEIDLEHVRAADGLRISYDLERDGYKIEQSRWTDESLSGEDWVEVAFVQAWALDTRVDEK